MAVGIGYRREMTAWDLSQVFASFFEVCPENWIRRDRTRLHEMTAAGRDVRLHGVSLNLGGTGPISTSFLYQVIFPLRLEVNVVELPWQMASVP